MADFAWTLSVTLGGVDVSADLTGEWEVEAEEDVARIASFSLYKTGTFDPTAYVGASVVIAASIDGGAAVTLFTGAVMGSPDIDEEAGTLRFLCADNLKEYWRAKTEAEILTALPGGFYNEQVFGRRETGFRQYQDVLSTLPASFHLGPTGTPTLTNFEGTDPDGEDTAADVDEGSVSIETLDVDQIVNNVSIEAKVRFTRRHYREHAFSWDLGQNTWCDWYNDSYTLPTRDTIESAAAGTGWKTRGEVVFAGHPASGTYTCYQGGFSYSVIWIIDEDTRAQTCIGADWTAIRNWTQTVTETYNITVRCATSIAATWGTRSEDDAAGYIEPYDDASWDNNADTAVPSGGNWAVNAIGDYASDEITRASANAVFETLYNLHRSEMMRSHRMRITYQRDLLPSLDLSQRRWLHTSRVNAVAKVSRLIHSGSFDTGDARSVVTIAPLTNGTFNPAYTPP